MPHTIELPVKPFWLYIPTNLGECNPEQYIDMAELLYRFTHGLITYNDVRVQGAYKLMNLAPSKKRNTAEDDVTKYANLYQISEVMDSFFQDNEGKKTINIDFIHNPIPKFKPLWQWYYGPADTFTNITFGEYLDGLRLYFEYTAVPDERTLRMLAAIFYRRAQPWRYFKKKLPSYTGDIREAYNPHTLEDRADVFKYMPKGFLFGFYLTFAAFQKFITGAVVPWGNRELELSILFEDNEGDGQIESVPGRGMDAVASALAESGQMGTIEQVRKANMWDVLLLLYDLKKQELDRKAQEKTQK